MNRVQKIKLWIKNHPEESILIAIYGAAAAVFTLAIVAGMKEQGAFNEWAMEQDAKGLAVIMLANGQVMTVPKDAPMGIYG